MGPEAKGQFDQLPIEIKEKLLILARKLPEAARSQFVRQTARRISEVAAEHPRTFLYGGAGWILGEVIDNILTIEMPFSDVVVCLTGDKASDLGGVAGTVYGFFEDKQSKAQRREIAKIVGEELRAAHLSTDPAA